MCVFFFGVKSLHSAYHSIRFVSCVRCSCLCVLFGNFIRCVFFSSVCCVIKSFLLPFSHPRGKWMRMKLMPVCCIAVTKTCTDAEIERNSDEAVKIGPKAFCYSRSALFIWVLLSSIWFVCSVAFIVRQLWLLTEDAYQSSFYYPSKANCEPRLEKNTTPATKHYLLLRYGRWENDILLWAWAHFSFRQRASHRAH